MNNNEYQELSKYAKSKFNCHSVILYGSYVSGDFTNESDIDIVCFTDEVTECHDTSMFKGIQLDMWVHSTGDMEKIDELLHIHDGIILLDENGLANNLMNEVSELYKKGPKQISIEEIKFLKNWLKKMLARSLKEDDEGNFRLHWMLVDALEIYFKINNIWYLGPKKSIKWLMENDIEMYSLYSRALGKAASNDDIRNLIEKITIKE